MSLTSVVGVLNISFILFLSSHLKSSFAGLPQMAFPKIHCDTPDGTCFCPEDPPTNRYPDDGDPSCEHYYLCHMGRAFKRKCDVRTTFHPGKGECMPRERVPESICKLPVQCPPFINRYVEDPEDCTKFYLCFYQRPLLYGCPASNYFDPQKEQCVYNTLIAEECLRQADSKRGGGGELNQTQLVPEKTSLALSRVKARIAELNLKPSSQSTPPGSKSSSNWIAFAYPFGKFIHGGL